MTIGHKSTELGSPLSFPVACRKLNCQKRTEVSSGVSQNPIIIEGGRNLSRSSSPRLSQSTVNPGPCSAGFWTVSRMETLNLSGPATSASVWPSSHSNVFFRYFHGISCVPSLDTTEKKSVSASLNLPIMYFCIWIRSPWVFSSSGWTLLALCLSVRDEGDVEVLSSLVPAFSLSWRYGGHSFLHEHSPWHFEKCLS